MVDLAGRIVLVVGYGRIGSRVANYRRAFQMKVTAMDPGFHPARIACDGFTPARDFHAALRQADVVTLHCPLAPATHHLMDAAAFAALEAGRHPGEHGARPAGRAAGAGGRPGPAAGCRAPGSTCWRWSPPTPATRSMPCPTSWSARTTRPAPRKACVARRGRRRRTSSTCWTAGAIPAFMVNGELATPRE